LRFSAPHEAKSYAIRTERGWNVSFWLIRILRAARIGMSLVQQKKWTEAEPLLRECLDIREKTQPDVWSTFNTKSQLGGAMLGQTKYAEAEPLLLKGYEGMKQRAPRFAQYRCDSRAGRLVRREVAVGCRLQVARPYPDLCLLRAIPVDVARLADLLRRSGRWRWRRVTSFLSRSPRGHRLVHPACS
jgi:hypothetical protein